MSSRFATATAFLFAKDPVTDGRAIVWRVLGVSTEAWPKMSCFLAHLRECLAGGDSLCFVTVRLKLCSPEATSWATYGSRDAEFALKSTAQALVL